MTEEEKKEEKPKLRERMSEYMGKTFLFLLVFIFVLPLTILETIHYIEHKVSWEERFTIMACEDEFKQQLKTGYILIHSSGSYREEGDNLVRTVIGLKGRYDTYLLVHDLKCNIINSTKEESGYFFELDDVKDGN